MRGAEAILRKGRLLGRRTAVKERMRKSYRIASLDERLRRERTRGEARLLHKAKLAGVKCPTVLEVNEFSITMDFVKGNRPKMAGDEAAECGRMLAKLHAADIIHGDYTPANIIRSGKELYIIDFGLGFVSKDIEDKAVDVFTMLRALESEDKRKAFLSGYRAYEKADSVLKRVKGVEKRVRYAS